MIDTQPDRAIPFEFFASFERFEGGDPLIALEPPRWAAATHAIVIDQTVHYLWCDRNLANQNELWKINHATAAIDNPTVLTQDPRNPVLRPSEQGFDDSAVEYPFPFRNPADGRYYMYYRGKGRGTPEQTGLLVSDGDMGAWQRVQSTPVIAADAPHEADGATHPSIAVDGDTIHILYTGKATESYHDGLTMCHATASTGNPAAVTKNPANPVFTGSGSDWDSRALRETELFKGPYYYHVLYGGFDGQTWRIGHARTRDFLTYEANPYNPILSPSPDPEAWDCDGVLTAQIFEIGGAYYMLYAGRRGREWQTGLAKVR